MWKLQLALNALYNGVQPRTLELLQSLGLLEDVKAISTPPYKMAVHAAGHEIASEVNWADEADASLSIPHVRRSLDSSIVRVV